MEEMRMKNDAPSVSRSISPSDRKYVLTLADIPEAVPGPNAFAQQAARGDRHRMEGNAFYQQEVQKRKATPTNVVHPALRARCVSDPPSPPRDSSCTTMSPFVNVDQSLDTFPPLKLVPSNAHLAEPTIRGFLEERREMMQHFRNGSKDERTPVFVPSPNIASTDFADTANISKKRVEKEHSVSELSMKTPRKGILGRFKLPGNLRASPSPSTTSLEGVPNARPENKMPIKAQAVLGASPTKSGQGVSPSPSKISIPRSPSKRKHFFSRKESSTTHNHNHNTSNAPKSTETAKHPQSASTRVKSPTTAISDPTHNSYLAPNQTIFSPSNSEEDAQKCLVTRSQSLKYFDHSIPPTPPAKNTPPTEKAKREAALLNKSSRMPFHDDQSRMSREPSGIVNISGRTSPTRYGSYAHKEMPTLVTKPSVYSLHASVVPNLTEANTFEEMKARIDGLGLEGFSTPPENVRTSALYSKVYSPSVYSDDWAVRPNSVVVSPRQPAKHVTRMSNDASLHTKGSSSSGGEIPICYPELAKDPSVSSITALVTGFAAADGRQAGDRGRPPRHGETQSRDRGPSTRLSADASANFAAHPVGDDQSKTYLDSPTSFNHPSAAPSPLHLQAAVYCPPPRISSKLHSNDTKFSPTKHEHSLDSTGLGIDTPSRAHSTSPTRRNEIFDNAPSFPAHSAHNNTHSRSASPSTSFKDSITFSSDIDVDPQKLSPMKSPTPSSDKLDRMIDMLNRLQARNHDINSMRAEMRATNVRLDQRLAAVESVQRASSPGSSSEDFAGVREVRVPTAVAHDFYRCRSSALDVFGEADGVECDTIAELKETNRRLLEMVGGFAEQIQALERRVGG